MYFGLVLLPSGLRGLEFSSTFCPPWSPLRVWLFFPPPHSCTRGERGFCARIGLAALWLAKTWNFFKKILKLFFCLFFFSFFSFLFVFSFNYPQTPLRLLVATWRTRWQTLALPLSRSVPPGLCCFPICRRHPLISPPHHTGSQKTSVTN